MGFPGLNYRCISFLLCACLILARPVKRAPLEYLQTTQYGGVAFGLGDKTYLANIRYPKAILGGNDRATASRQGSLVPFAVVFADSEVVTAEYLQDIIASYLEGDDVFSEDFLEGIYIVNNGTSNSQSLDASALEYLNGLAPHHLLLDVSFKSSCCKFSDHPTLTARATPRETLELTILKTPRTSQ